MSLTITNSKNIKEFRIMCRKCGSYNIVIMENCNQVTIECLDCGNLYLI